MTMKRMEEYLENRGFKVEKKYNSSYRRYEFSIFKSGIEAHKNFEYPSYARDTSDMDKIQVEFLESLIKDWESAKSNVDDICGPEVAKYIDTDNALTKNICKNLLNSIYGAHPVKSVNVKHTFAPEIKNVIFNDPATIVFWGDGTKTVVKCGEDDIFDPEKGLAMAISKKFLGNRGNYYNEIKKWVDPFMAQPIYPKYIECPISDKLRKAFEDIIKPCNASTFTLTGSLVIKEDQK